MRTLVLVRHAKSSWAHPGTADHDRPLNERGRRDAPRMARRLAGRGLALDVILSSTAVRARSTADAFGAALGIAAEPDAELYGASGSTIVRAVALRDADGVVVVAHDPGLSMLAASLAPEIGHMPTCATAGFTWTDGDWADALDSAPDTWWFDTPRLS